MAFRPDVCRVCVHIDSTGCVEREYRSISLRAMVARISITYTELVVTRVYDTGGYLGDSVTTRLGIRTIVVIPHRGFYLNGHHRKLKGVCNHRDLGPLGAAVNRNALRHRMLEMLEVRWAAMRCTLPITCPILSL